MQPDPVFVLSVDGAEAVASRDWVEPFVLGLSLGAGSSLSCSLPLPESIS
jgi:hypothetical protein